jgi:cyclophilin family peptidyl-prolyl cis-trans isomerase
VFVLICVARQVGGAEPAAGQATLGKVTSLPDSVRQEWELSPFYKKYLSAGGLPVISSEKVSDYALLEAAYLIEQMLGHRQDIRAAMIRKKARVAVMAVNEFTTDVPEHSDRRPKEYWDKRARGLGGRCVSCGEENLLGYPGDPYAKENIFIHEFSHGIHHIGLSEVDPTFNRRLREAFDQAKQTGLWAGKYAMSNPAEYWAEGVQSWFDTNRENDAAHNHVNTREELKEYDPALAKLVEEVFGDRPWRYQRPADRTELAHLAGFDRSQAPRFSWPEELLEWNRLHARDVERDRRQRRDATDSSPTNAAPSTASASDKADLPRVVFQTELGDIEVELFAKQAPVTVTNFLRYVEAGFYGGGAFFRAVRMDNQPTNLVKIQVVQAQANPAHSTGFFPPIPLERTRDTSLKHLDGTLSMARNGPDTARDSFSICVGPQPELDFGGKRNPDGQGFAAFGRVVRGMEIVRAIHTSPSEGQRLAPPIRIHRARMANPEKTE